MIHATLRKLTVAFRKEMEKVFSTGGVVRCNLSQKAQETVYDTFQCVLCRCTDEVYQNFVHTVLPNMTHLFKKTK